MAKFMFSIATKYVGSKDEEEIEIPDEVLEDLTEEELEELVQEMYNEWLSETAYMNWYPAEESDGE